MKVSRIVVGLSIAVLCACAQTTASWVEEAPSVEDDVARSVEWMDIAPEKIGDPELLCTAGGYLLWVDNDMDRPLSVLYLPTGEISAPLRKGRAGGEVLNIQQILRDVDTVGRFAAVDGFKHRIVCLSADRGTLSREGEYPIDAFSSVTLSGDSVVGLLRDGSARYGIGSLGGSSTAGFGDYSTFGLTNEAGWGLLQGHVVRHPRSERIAWFGYYTAACKIVDFEERKTLCSHLFDLSAFDAHGKLYVTMRPESRVGFIGATACEEGIFALYDGKELSYYMSHRGLKPHGSTICFFTWDGCYAVRLCSDSRIRSIAWNEEQRILYICLLDGDAEYRIGRMALEPSRW